MERQGTLQAQGRELDHMHRYGVAMLLAVLALVAIAEFMMAAYWLNRATGAPGHDRGIGYDWQSCRQGQSAGYVQDKR